MIEIVQNLLTEEVSSLCTKNYHMLFKFCPPWSLSVWWSHCDALPGADYPPAQDLPGSSSKCPRQPAPGCQSSWGRGTKNWHFQFDLFPRLKIYSESRFIIKSLIFTVLNFVKTVMFYHRIQSTHISSGSYKIWWYSKFLLPKLRVKLLVKLDGVGPVDNRPSSD